MYAVIMAGGTGTRFWPLSRRSMPKQLLKIVGSRTMIQQTVDRLQPLVPPERILVITCSAHAAELRRQLEVVPEENIIVEPIGRNTAACLGLAAVLLEDRAPSQVMAALPADHMILNPEAFRETLSAAEELAKAEDVLITLGIRPLYPETGYGYIQAGEEAAEARGKVFHRVVRFHEKPDSKTAARFLEAGCFFWNSGMFIWKARTILKEFERHLRDLHDGLTRIRARIKEEPLSKLLQEVYPALPSISVDYGIMEKTDRALMLKADFGWSDVGSWAAAAETWERDRDANAIRGGPYVQKEASGCVGFLPDGRKILALVGVRDLVIVDTPDALLVCGKDHAQEVKNIVEKLEKDGLDEYL